MSLTNQQALDFYKKYIEQKHISSPKNTKVAHVFGKSGSSSKMLSSLLTDIDDRIAKGYILDPSELGRINSLYVKSGSPPIGSAKPPIGSAKPPIASPMGSKKPSSKAPPIVDEKTALNFVNKQNKKTVLDRTLDQVESDQKLFTQAEKKNIINEIQKRKIELNQQEVFSKMSLRELEMLSPTQRKIPIVKARIDQLRSEAKKKIDEQKALEQLQREQPQEFEPEEINDLSLPYKFFAGINRGPNIMQSGFFEDTNKNDPRDVLYQQEQKSLRRYPDKVPQIIDNPRKISRQQENKFYNDISRNTLREWTEKQEGMKQVYPPISGRLQQISPDTKTSILNNKVSVLRNILGGSRRWGDE